MKWFALLLLCPPAFATPSLRQWCSKGTGGTPNTSLNCGSTTGDHLFSGPQVQPSDLLIVSVRTNVIVSSIADTRGLTFNPAVPQLSTIPGGPSNSSIYCAQTGVAAAANDTITVTLGSAVTFWGFSVTECAGCSLAACGTIAAANAGPTSSGTWSAGTLTTNANNDLILGTGLSFARQTWTASGSFTMRFTESSNNGILVEDELLASAGAVTPQATGASQSWIGEGAAFKTQSGSYTYKQTSGASDQTGNPFSTYNATITSTTAGDFLECTANWFGGQFTGVTDGGSDRFYAFGPVLTNPHGDHLQGFYAYNIAGGTTTATMNGSGMTFLEIRCSEYSGIANTAPLDISSPVDIYAGCSPNCIFSGSSTFTATTAAFPSGYSPTSGSMPFACGGGTCQAEIDAVLFKPASGTADFGLEYGDYSSASTCTVPWVQETLDGNGSQWCTDNVTFPSASSGFSNTFVF